LIRTGRFFDVEEILQKQDGDDIDSVVDDAITNNDLLTIIFVTCHHYGFIYPDGLINALRHGSEEAFRYILFSHPESKIGDLRFGDSESKIGDLRFGDSESKIGDLRFGDSEFMEKYVYEHILKNLGGDERAMRILYGKPFEIYPDQKK
jgi:hypothetical protein